MAKSTVPVNFKDDIMNSAMNGKRRYRMINNSDGTISLEDVTTYDQVGSNFGAAQMNATNQAVNAAADASKIIDDIDAIRALTQEGYMAGALALKQVDDSLTAYKPIFNSGYIPVHSIAYGEYVILTAEFDTPFKDTNYLFFAYCADGGFTGFSGTCEGNNIGYEYGKYTDKCTFRVRNIDHTEETNTERPIFWEAIGF